MSGPVTGAVAAIDCGTNSFRLLIAAPGPDGRLVELTRQLTIVRLGQGVDASGVLRPDALARTFAAADRYAELVRAHGIGPTRIRIVATSAAREARNAADFLDGMRRRFGVRPERITGAEEARLAFAGALSGVSPSGVSLSGISLSGVPVAIAGPVLVTDVGGGSTELVRGEPGRGIENAVSLDIGSVRLTERFGLVGPVPAGARSAAVAYVDRLLDRLEWLSGIDTWIGVAGTVTTMSAVAQELPAYDRSRVHRSILATGQISRLLERLSAMTVAEIRALGAVEPGRGDVLTAGALIADRLARRVRRPMLVSEADLLDGIALGLLDDTGRMPR